MADTTVPAPSKKKEKKEDIVLREPGTPPTAKTLELLEKMKKRIGESGALVPERWKYIEKSVQDKVELSDSLVDETVDWFCKEKVLDDKEADFSMTKFLVELYSECPFFAEVSRWVKKTESKHTPGGAYLPTAAMCYDIKTDDFELRYNRRFMASLTPIQLKNVLVHEFYHLIWRHITTRRRSPNVAWNIATDLAINSIIINSQKEDNVASKDVYTKYLPDRLYLPTVKPEMGHVKDMTKEEKEVNEKYADLIAKLPEKKASEAYFSSLLEWARQNGYEWGDRGVKIPNSGVKFKKKNGGGDNSGAPMPGEGDGDGEMTDEVEIETGDVHDMWDEVPDEIRDLVEGKMKGIVEKATRRADNQSNGWGTIPADIVSEIKASILQTIDWKEVLRNFVGMTNRGSRITTMKRINKRYPYVHPGTRRGYNPKMLVAVDQSGSVDDLSLQRIFGVLADCSRKTTFTVLPFDHTVDDKNMFEWKRGQKPNIKRTRSGGTSFQAVIDFVNKSENRGKWDGVIICTDGECSKPTATHLRTGWVIVPGRQLMFPTTDLVVQMTDEKSSVIKKGAVR